MNKEMDFQAVAAIRSLAIDMVEKANSGHPGMPMGAAPMAYALWAKQMNFAPTRPKWINRDRFVLAAGHGSALLYAMMYLFGYEDVTIDELKRFRQLGSKTPGHPEYLHTAGVDATSGPLGQGIGMAVGMAMAEAHLGATYNREAFDIINHYTYALCGDGDLMEGVTSEVSSLAGHLKLGKLIVLYDSNNISLDGDLDQAFSEEVLMRYQAYGWHVLKVEDGNDTEAISQAIQEAKENVQQPTLIEIKTVIGYGSPKKAGSSSAHGAPLGKEEAVETKASYGWTAAPFDIPAAVLSWTRQRISDGESKVQAWEQKFSAYQKMYPELAHSFQQAVDFSYDITKLDFPKFDSTKKIATRATSGTVLNELAKQIPALFGGSADLSSSNKTYLEGLGDFKVGNYENRNIWFGVREFGMATIANGLQLHGGVEAFCSTFFVFSDYLRPALRMSALMKLPVKYVFTHDSIAVGEDGPTHEPIEHLAALRAMPGIDLIRPADGKEVRAAWKLALKNRTEPTLLALTRQDLPLLSNEQSAIDQGVEKGAYVVVDGIGQLDGILLATGSEVHLALAAQKKLAAEGLAIRVVSMPSWHRFEKQTNDYKEKIIPKNISKRLAVEMGTKFGWREYVGDHGGVHSIETFGQSAPAEELMVALGFSVDQVVKHFKTL